MNNPGYFTLPYTVVNGPVTDEELSKMYEAAGLDAKAYLLQRDKAKADEKQYYLDHSACPECGCDKHSSTYMGYIRMVPDFPKDFKDKNRVKCSQCSWKGITHDLVKPKCQ